MIEKLVLIGHVLTAAAVIGLVLLQQGKGADAGASFGGGASQTVFGSQGTTNFLTRLTAVLAAVFFVTSFSLAIFAKQRAAQQTDTSVPALQEAASRLEAAEAAPEENDAPATGGDVPVIDAAPAGSDAADDVPVPPASDVPPVDEPASPPPAE